MNNEIINNTYFQNLIATGATTREDLEAMAVIRPYGNGFIGVSQESLEWSQASILARKTGAEVLEPALDDAAAIDKLMAWLAVNLAGHMVAPVWVQENGQARILDGKETIAVTGTNRARKTLFAWNLSRVAPAESAPAPNPDSERLLAMSILSKGGRIKIREGARERAVQKQIELPDGSIELTEVDTYSTAAVFDDEDARLMENCRNIRNIRIFKGSMTFLPFQSLPELESLEISISRMDIGSFRNLPMCQKLRALNLAGMRLDGTICKLASQMAALEDIVLEGNIVRPGDLVALSGLPRLRRLAFNNHPINDERILSEISRIQQLESLRLDALDLSDAQVEGLLDLANLSDLTLFNARLSEAAWIQLAKLPALRSATFNGSNFTDGCLQALSGHRSLNLLALNDTYVTGHGFNQCSPLHAMSEIHLGLYKDHVTDAGIAAMRRA